VAEEELTDVIKRGVKVWAGFFCLRMYYSYEDL